MNKIILLLLCISVVVPCFGVSYEPNESYYQNCSGLQGEELKTCLHHIISGHKVFPYFGDGEIGSAEIMMDVDVDPDNPDNIICFYSGFSYPKSWTDLGRKGNYAALGTSHDNSWNREHVWSKSHGFPQRLEDMAYSDVHNLRPEDRTVNSSKGAKDFDWGGFEEPEVENCFTDIDSWEAPDRVKGDIARCIFYMSTRYEGTDTPYDLEIVDYTNTEGPIYGKLSTLLEWNKLDPPDEYERRRNHIIYTKYQGNRNPFIDHPEYAFAIWGEPEYQPRITTSEDILYYDAVQNKSVPALSFIVTAVNQPTNLKLQIEEYSDIFSFEDNNSEMYLTADNNFINQEVTIYLNPVTSGEIVSTVIFDGFEHEVELNAMILPENGKWFIDEAFNSSIENFSQVVLQGNPKFGWHHSTWDNDAFARVRETKDDLNPRECWLASPPFSSGIAKTFYLNFKTARNRNKTPDQFQVFISSQIPDAGIPDDAYQLHPVLSEGNYNWKNSSWLIIDRDDLPDNEQLYLLFRYNYDGNAKGQETWEIDNVKLYGK